MKSANSTVTLSPAHYTPFLVGSGRASLAIRQSLRIIEELHAGVRFAPFRNIARDAPLRGVTKGVEKPLLFIANPHALHAPRLIEGDAEAFVLMVVEKPAAVNLAQCSALAAIRSPVAVCHVYRQMWGIQKLRELVASGDLGALIAVEGRYWQSSAAQRVSLAATGAASSAKAKPSWKNDVALSGASDALIDVGVHWVDACDYLVGQVPQATQVWRSFVNAESPHRDTHVQLQRDYPGGTRAMASISKTVHGAPNHFEINLIGSKKYAAWKFLEADQIEIGEGASRSFLYRSTCETGARLPPFHGVGWIEGYTEIVSRALAGLDSGDRNGYPNLPQHLAMLRTLLEVPDLI